MAQLDFDARNVDPSSTFDPIPAGWYKAMITESELKPTRNGQGQYLQLTLQVLEGEHAGRILWERLNRMNQSATAVEIAQKTLSAICHAVGVMVPKDSSQLHNKPLMAKVKVVPADGQYDAKNEITGYKAIDGKEPATAAATTTQTEQSAQAAASNDTPPWNR